MGRLIDADKLWTAVTKRFDECDEFLEVIEEQPTITPDSNDGWILCSEKMPEEEDSCWAKFYGTDKWRGGMFRKRSEFVDVTVVRSNGEREVALANTLDGKWSLMTSWIPDTAKVIAWKPRIEPYKGEVKHE